MLKHFSLFSFSILFLAGCATARLPQGPDLFALESFPQSSKLAVSKVIDNRGTDKAGTIGAASIRVKEEIVDFTTGHLMKNLNEHLNVNVVPAEAITEENAAEVIRGVGADGAIVARINHLEMHSMDAIMEPVEVDMNIDVIVFDANGNVVADSDVTGYYQKRIGLSIVDKSTGQLVDNTVKNAMTNLVKDSKIKSAVAKLA